MSDAPRPRLLLVDDEPEFLEVLRAWFEGRGFEVEVATDALSALAHLRGDAFDVAITDLRLPGVNGLQFQGLARELAPQMDVVFLTAYGTMADAIAALREGRAFDFLLKPLGNLHELQLVVDRALARRATCAVPPPVPPVARLPVPTTGPDRLTAREVEIIEFLALGLANREIAARLCLSEKTVKNHLARIYDKLQVANRTQAVVACGLRGITRAPA